MTDIVSGPDVSFWQDAPPTARQIDFVQLAKKSQFVIIRAGISEYPDPDFDYNWQESKEAGLPRGSYWYYDNYTHPKRQAEAYLRMFEGSDFGELPLFADFEDGDPGIYRGWKHWYDFLFALEEGMSHPHTIGIYTRAEYWEHYGPNPIIDPAANYYFSKYPLWVAQYKTLAPDVPLPWDKYKFWQFTDEGPGLEYGVESKEIDLNKYNGTLDEFYSEFGKPVQRPAQTISITITRNENGSIP